MQCLMFPGTERLQHSITAATEPCSTEVTLSDEEQPRSTFEDNIDTSRPCTTAEAE